ncbi:hypothetical protein RSSE_p0008 (plasmid) [Ralstonia solanacearum]|nr:hypothetical protein RSSE_p0008 [Ralstonia solanacearum]
MHGVSLEHCRRLVHGPRQPAVDRSRRMMGGRSYSRSIPCTEPPRGSPAKSRGIGLYTATQRGGKTA